MFCKAEQLTDAIHNHFSVGKKLRPEDNGTVKMFGIERVCLSRTTM